MTAGDDTEPRPLGCLCQWEQGDSPCPVHDACDGAAALVIGDPLLRSAEVRSVLGEIPVMCLTAGVFLASERGRFVPLGRAPW